MRYGHNSVRNVGKHRNTDEVGTYYFRFLLRLHSRMRIHCPLLLKRNDDQLQLLANEDKLTSAASQ